MRFLFLLLDILSVFAVEMRLMLWHHLDDAPPPCVGAAPGRTAAPQSGMDAGCCRSCCCCCAKLLCGGGCTERERGRERAREGGRESCALSRHGGEGNSHANISRDCLTLPSDGGWDGVAPTHVRRAMFGILEILLRLKMRAYGPWLKYVQQS